MAVVSGGLLDEVRQDPAQAPPPTLGVAPDRQVVEVSFGDGPSAALAGSAVQRPQLLGIIAFGRVELPVSILVPRGAGPWFKFGSAAEADVDPVILDEREMLEQASQGEGGRRQSARPTMASQRSSTLNVLRETHGLEAWSWPALPSVGWLRMVWAECPH